MKVSHRDTYVEYQLLLYCLQPELVISMIPVSETREPGHFASAFAFASASMQPSCKRND